MIIILTVCRFVAENYKSFMENLFVKGENHFPSIDFKNNGYLSLKGKSFYINSNAIFEPIIIFATELKIAEVFFTIELTLLNTSTAKHLFLIIKELEKNNNVKKVYLKWHLDNNDSDSFDFGETLNSSFSKCRIEYVENEVIV